MDDKERAIRARAHKIWLAEGEPEGRDAAHWDQAERELASGGNDEQAVDVALPEAVSNESGAGTKPRKKTAKTLKGT